MNPCQFDVLKRTENPKSPLAHSLQMRCTGNEGDVFPRTSESRSEITAYTPEPIIAIRIVVPSPVNCGIVELRPDPLLIPAVLP